MTYISESLQLTQGLLVASTALLGLSGLFVAQLTLGAGEDSIDRLENNERCWAKWLLLSSIVLGTVTILLCLYNLLARYECSFPYFVATVLTALQVITFVSLVIFLIMRKFKKTP